jgi:hypothetical protein
MPILFDSTSHTVILVLGLLRIKYAEAEADKKPHCDTKTAEVHHGTFQGKAAQ